jgi:hypothetical protein
MFSLKTINNTDPGSYKFTIRTKRKRTKNANKTNEKQTNASHERYETNDTRNEQTNYTKERYMQTKQTKNANDTKYLLT